MRIADPEQPETPGVNVEIRAGESVGDVADRAAALLDREADTGVVTIQQRFVRHARGDAAAKLDDRTEALLIA